MIKTKRNNTQYKAYFDWLCGLVKGDKPGRNRLEFVWSLHQKEFVSILPNDDNRIEDGLKLRQRFAEENNLPEDCPCKDEDPCEQPCTNCHSNDCKCLYGPCSVLEMLIALAQRIEYLMQDPDEDDRTDQWFWGMIENLGLDIFPNTVPNRSKKVIENGNILNTFISRQYARDGKGGLFPLRKSKVDQRGVELWYQMMAYIQENNPE